MKQLPQVFPLKLKNLKKGETYLQEYFDFMLSATKEGTENTGNKKK